MGICLILGIELYFWNSGLFVSLFNRNSLSVGFITSIPIGFATFLFFLTASKKSINKGIICGDHKTYFITTRTNIRHIAELILFAPLL